MPSNLKRMLFGWLVLFGTMQGTTYGQEYERTRTLSLDSRYFIKGYSNRAAGQFGIELQQLAGLPADLIFREDPEDLDDKRGFLFYNARQLRNLIEGLTMIVSTTALGNDFQLAYHEYGHGTRLAAVGYRPVYGHGDTGAGVDSGRKYDNIFWYFLSSFFRWEGGYTITEGTLFDPITSRIDAGWQGLIYMGGLNNEMLFSEMIEDAFREQGGHVGFINSYINGKLAVQQYSYGIGLLNDLSNTINFYRIRGYSIDHLDVERAAAISFFSSSLSYQFLYHFFGMFAGVSPRFHALEPAGIQLPNLSFFMNPNGLSYRARTGYRHGDWRFPVAFEWIFKGREQVEFSLGAARSFGRFEVWGLATTGKGFDVDLGLHYRVKSWLRFAGGYGRYSISNLNGARIIPSLEHGSVYHDVYFQASIVY